MNALATRLAARIATSGPITVAEFMSAALADRSHGYYRESDPLGAEGDFITAPEISQLFGELIGAWLIDCWERIGRPDPVNLVELGPGRGTLMQDALRVGSLVPAWLDAIRLHLVEINATLRGEQAARLAHYRPQWHETLADVPEGPLLLVANEFFDALPIRQLVFAGGIWRERLVAWTRAAGFHFAMGAPSPLAPLVPATLRAAESGVFELSPASIGIASDIAARVARAGGAALIIDYGRAESAVGESLQAARRHRRAGIFDGPGEDDLSAHVDFALLARAGVEAGAAAWGPVTQGAFLDALGARYRAQALMRKAGPEKSAVVERAVERLTGPDAMGTLFKVLAFAPAGSAPAGFSVAA